MNTRPILMARPKNVLVGRGVIHYEPHRNPALLRREERVANEFYNFVDKDLDLAKFDLRGETLNRVKKLLNSVKEAREEADVIETHIASRFLARALLNSKGGKEYQGFLERMSRHRNQYHYWAVATVEFDLARYYRWFVDRELLNLTDVEGMGLIAPSHIPHISITRGINDLIEVPKEERRALWGKYEGEEIEFTYEPDLRFTGDTTGDRPAVHWFLVVNAPKLKQIREEFDIPTNWNLHLTIGKFNDTWTQEPQDPRLKTFHWRGR